MFDLLRSLADKVWQWIATNLGLQPDPDLKSWLEFGAAAVTILSVIVSLLYWFFFTRKREKITQEQIQQISLHLAELRQAQADAAKRIEKAVTALADLPDETSAHALKLLKDGDTRGAKQVFGEIMEAKAREGGASLKQAAEAARNLAALTEDQQEVANLYQRAAELDPENAQNWIDLGDLSLELGRVDEARQAYTHAVESAVRKQDTALANAARKRLGDLLHNDGDKLFAARQLWEALNAYNASLSIRQQLAAADPANDGWQRDLALTQEKSGDVLVAQSDPLAVLEAHRNLAIADRLATAHPTNDGWRRDRIIAKERLDDVLPRGKAQADSPLAAYKASLQIKQRLAGAVPDTQYQRELCTLHDKLGDVLVSQGELADALKAYRNSLAMYDRLPPNDDLLQLQLARLLDKLGDLLVAQGNPEPALQHYERALGIKERPAAGRTDTAATWALAVSHEKIGDAQRAQLNLGLALSSYRRALELAEPLAEATTANAEWQQNLAALQENLGDMLVAAQGNLPDGLQAYRDSLATREGLATAEPDDTGRQRELARSHERLGDILARQNEKDESLAAWERALKIYRRLVERNPDDVQERLYLVEPLRRIGVLKGADGRIELEEARAILVTVTDRLDPYRKGWIAELGGQIAALPK